MDKEKLLSYTGHYSDHSFCLKVVNLSCHVKKKVVYKAAILYVILTESEAPAWVKASIIGALGYLICPLDTVPDILPGVGFIDDVSLMGFLIVEISAYVTSSVQKRAEAFRDAWCVGDVSVPSSPSLPSSHLVISSPPSTPSS